MPTDAQCLDGFSAEDRDPSILNRLRGRFLAAVEWFAVRYTLSPRCWGAWTWMPPVDKATSQEQQIAFCNEYLTREYRKTMVAVWRKNWRRLPDESTLQVMIKRPSTLGTAHLYDLRSTAGVKYEDGRRYRSVRKMTYHGCFNWLSKAYQHAPAQIERQVREILSE